MIQLSRSVRQSVVLNKNGAQSRAIASLADKLLGLDNEKSNDSFTKVAKNTIHRLKFENEYGEIKEIGELGQLLYPGSLSTAESKGEPPYHVSRREIKLSKLIDFKNKQTKNQLSILLMTCPKLLCMMLEKAFPIITIFKSVTIIQLSYENYDDPKQGRKACLAAANEIGFRLAKLNRWAYFSALAAPIQPDDEHLCLFKNGLANIIEGSAANLHVKVTSNEGCAKISLPPFNDSVGIIYAKIPDNMQGFRMLYIDDEK